MTQSAFQPRALDSPAGALCTALNTDDSRSAGCRDLFNKHLLIEVLWQTSVLCATN